MQFNLFLPQRAAGSGGFLVLPVAQQLSLRWSDKGKKRFRAAKWSRTATSLFDGLLYALVAFVEADYITGVMCAVVDKKLSSA
ncbi:MAG: phage holin family protein, partial [Hydrogenoanaerobacterium sp.]